MLACKVARKEADAHILTTDVSVAREESAQEVAPFKGENHRRRSELKVTPAGPNISGNC